MQNVKYTGDDLLLGGEASGADHTAGKVSTFRFHEVYAARAKRRDVCLCGSVFPHDDVHRRSDDHGCFGCEKECGQEVISNAIGELRQNIRRGGSDQECVYVLRNGNVLHRGIEVRY